jgi:hypothetical protein
VKGEGKGREGKGRERKRRELNIAANLSMYINNHFK